MRYLVNLDTCTYRPYRAEKPLAISSRSILNHLLIGHGCRNNGPLPRKVGSWRSQAEEFLLRNTHRNAISEPPPQPCSTHHIRADRKRRFLFNHHQGSQEQFASSSSSSNFTPVSPSTSATRSTRVSRRRAKTIIPDGRGKIPAKEPLTFAIPAMSISGEKTTEEIDVLTKRHGGGVGDVHRFDHVVGL